MVNRTDEWMVSLARWGTIGWYYDDVTDWNIIVILVIVPEHTGTRIASLS